MEMLDTEIITLVQPDPREMEAAVIDLTHSWKRFKELAERRPDAATDPKLGLEWWRVLERLSLADSRMKEAFLCGDRRPVSIAQYAKYRRTLLLGERYRTDS